MSKQTLQIKNVLGGHSESYYLGTEGTFDFSLAIDPDFPINGNKA